MSDIWPDIWLSSWYLAQYLADQGMNKRSKLDGKNSKSIKIIAKIVQSRGLEGVLAALGWLLDGSWLPGTSGGLKITILPGSRGDLGGALAASWGVPEVSWGALDRLGGVLGFIF